VLHYSQGQAPGFFVAGGKVDFHTKGRKMTKALWTASIDFAVALILYFCGKYLTPDYFEDVKFVLVAVNVYVAVLLAHFYGAEIRRFVDATIRALRR